MVLKTFASTCTITANATSGLYGTVGRIAVGNSTAAIKCAATATTAALSPLNTFRILWIDPRTAAWQASLPGFLVQVIIVLALTRILGKLLSYIRQPPVIGEIIAGIILGPSVLGWANGWTAAIFPPSGMSQFSLVANIGLIFFMFYLGLELDHGLMKSQFRTALPIATASIAVPFAVGAVASIWWYEVNGLPGVNRTAFILFSGASMSFTAFPVLASILNHLNLLHKPIGVLALSIASIDDITAWCTLAVASSFAKFSEPIYGVWTTLMAILYVVVMFFVLQPLLCEAYLRFFRASSSATDSRNFIVGTFLYLVASAFTCETMGIHAFFGSFLAGVIFPRKDYLVKLDKEKRDRRARIAAGGAGSCLAACDGDLSESVDDIPDFIHFISPKIELIIVDFFLPMYFALSGIKTQIGSLDTGVLWGDCIGVIVIACAAKFVPACLSTKLWAPPDPVTGEPRDWRFALTMGFVMNTRGLVELIALNIAHDAGILSDRMFTILVLMAIVTTLMTTPAMHYLYMRHHPQEKSATLGALTTSGGAAHDDTVTGGAAAVAPSPHMEPVMFATRHPGSSPTLGTPRSLQPQAPPSSSIEVDPLTLGHGRASSSGSSATVQNPAPLTASLTANVHGDVALELPRIHVDRTVDDANHIPLV